MNATRLYLYAIVAGTHPLESALTGLADAAVTLLPFRDLAGVVSPVALESVQPDPAQLLCHERVVEELMVDRSTLPVRFGTVLSDADAVCAALAECYDTFMADLIRLDGRVEVGLRILWDAEVVRCSLSPSQPAISAPEDERPGTRYMRARAAEIAVEHRLQDEAQVLKTWCLARLGPFACDTSARLLTTAAMPVSAVLLTSRRDMAALLAAAADLQRERPDLDIVCTGPWPPYHFVTQ
jgi:hypothetical protein